MQVHPSTFEELSNTQPLGETTQPGPCLSPRHDRRSALSAMDFSFQTRKPPPPSHWPSQEAEENERRAMLNCQTLEVLMCEKVLNHGVSCNFERENLKMGRRFRIYLSDLPSIHSYVKVSSRRIRWVVETRSCKSSWSFVHDSVLQWDLDRLARFRRRSAR